MARLRCASCHQYFESEQSRAMPFCSERCRLIDLGRWLNEDIGLPVEETDKGPGRLDEPHRDPSAAVDRNRFRRVGDRWADTSRDDDLDRHA